MAYSVWSLGGGGALGSAREGSRSLLCLHHATRLLSSKIFYRSGAPVWQTTVVHTLLWPPKTLRAVKLEAQVGLLTCTPRYRRKYELKQYRRPENFAFFKFVYMISRGTGSSVFVRSPFRDEQGARSIRRPTQIGCV